MSLPRYLDRGRTVRESCRSTRRGPMWAKRQLSYGLTDRIETANHWIGSNRFVVNNRFFLLDFSLLKSTPYCNHYHKSDTHVIIYFNSNVVYEKDEMRWESKIVKYVCGRLSIIRMIAIWGSLTSQTCESTSIHLITTY